MQIYNNKGVGVSLKNEKRRNFNEFNLFKPLILKITQPINDALSCHSPRQFLHNPSHFLNPNVDKYKYCWTSWCLAKNFLGSPSFRDSNLKFP